MKLNIVIRATDPARAAELLGQLGIRLEEPNRPNPGTWHAWLATSVTVRACEHGEEPKMALAIPGCAAALAAMTPSGVASSHDGAALVDLGGVTIPFRSGDGAVARPAADEALLPFAEAVLQRVRFDLAAILTRHAPASVRLAGPQMLNRGVDRCFALVIGGADHLAIAELQSLLDANAHPTFRIDAVDASEIGPDVEERLQRLAWDLHL